MLPSILDWDAIWFASRSLPDFPLVGFNDLPSQRGENQKYILWEIESAAHLYGFHPENYKDFFNWTVTYRQDSTVTLPYGWLNKIKKHPEGEKLKSYIQQFGKKNKHLAAKESPRNATVAWMVSNCLTESNREGFVEKLQEFLAVDVYGGCYEDSLECGRDDANGCWDMIASKYKFYLSFENSICKDYVTEKFFDPLQRNIIPIVLGGADYSKIAPPHSYIDALQGDPKSLAKLLNKIASNDALYASYFWWKQFYSVGGFSPQDRAKAPCTVCQMLHQEKVEQEEVYQDMKRWWVGEANCQGLLYDRKILDLDDEDEDLELDLDDDIEDVDVENMLIHFYGYFPLLYFVSWNLLIFLHQISFLK